MRFVGPTFKVAVLGLVAAALVGACSSATGAGAGASSTPALTLGIAAPADGATVTTPFEVRVTSNVQLGAPDTGDHHFHLFFDTTSTAGTDYQMVFGNSVQVTNLAPGRHTILVSLRNPDHSDAGAMAMITVTVAAGSGSPAGGQPSAAPGKSPAATPAPTPPPHYSY